MPRFPAGRLPVTACSDADSPPGASEGGSDATDVALMAAVADGHPEALAELYERHATPVRNFARRLASDHADDVIQEVFLRLWYRPEAFDPARGTLRSYLLMQAHGRSVDLLRSSTSRKARELVDFSRRDRGDAPSAAHVGAHLDGTWPLLSQLPYPEREPIFRAYFLGYTYREVADQLRLPEGTVKSRIRAGLARLRAILADDVIVHAAPSQTDQPAPEASGDDRSKLRRGRDGAEDHHR